MQWAWPVLVTLVVALLATVVVVVVQVAADDEAEPLLVATTEQPTVPTITEIVPTETVAPTAPAPTEAPPPLTPPPATPQAGGRLITWPAGVDGYTVVLSSLPAAGGRAEAFEKGRAAVDAGLTEVGIIDSSRFSSLHPGYYVVFSGVYGSMAEATRFVDDARRAGFDTAYARLIAS
jgi:hypothetical protein